MLLDRLVDVVGATIMQEEDALADAPQRRGAELAAVRLALRYSVGQAVPHVMQREVAEWLECLFTQGGNVRLARGQASDVAGLTADIGEDLLPARNRRGRRRGGCSSRGRRAGGGRKDARDIGACRRNGGRRCLRDRGGCTRRRGGRQQ